MRVIAHHIYEYKKGLRYLAMDTLHSDLQSKVEKKLNELGISYVIQEVNENKINIFFGDTLCVKIAEGFVSKSLNDLTNEEDFILGIMLGYCRKQQCERYIKRKKRLIKKIDDFNKLKIIDNSKEYKNYEKRNII